MYAVSLQLGVLFGMNEVPPKGQNTDRDPTQSRHSAREGLALNKTLLAGDMPSFFFLLADFMAERRLTMPAESVALFKERGLMEREQSEWR